MSKLLSDNTFVLASKVYASGIGVILLPFFLEMLGKEQYGLIGSFVVFQACMQILDAGVSGVLTRQSIITQKNIKSFESFIITLKYVFVLFTGISISIAIFGWYFSEKYSVMWFKTNIGDEVIIFSVALMFSVFALRYIQGPLRSLLLSYEKHKLISLIDIVYFSLSGPAALLVLKISNGDITDYFMVQIFSALFVLAVLSYFAWSETLKVIMELKGNKNDGVLVKTSLSELVKFGMQLSTLSMLWVIINQSDKLVLTKYMDLSEFSFYAVSISILGLVNIFVGATTQTVRPKLIAYLNRLQLDKFISLYKNTVIYLIGLLIPLIMFLIFFGEDLLFFWTGKEELSTKVMLYLPYLLIGTFFVAMSEFSFMILYSTGNLKEHTIFYSLVSLFIIPLNIFVASNFLGEGSSKLFMCINLVLFLTWSLYNISVYVSGAAVFFGGVILVSLFASILMIYIANSIVDDIGFIWLGLLCILGLIAVVISYLLSLKLTEYINVGFKRASL